MREDILRPKLRDIKQKVSMRQVHKFLEKPIKTKGYKTLVSLRPEAHLDYSAARR